MLRFVKAGNYGPVDDQQLITNDTATWIGADVYEDACWGGNDIWQEIRKAVYGTRTSDIRALLPSSIVSMSRGSILWRRKRSG